jgi:hypothetical protein
MRGLVSATYALIRSSGVATVVASTTSTTVLVSTTDVTGRHLRRQDQQERTASGYAQAGPRMPGPARDVDQATLAKIGLRARVRVRTLAHEDGARG